MFLDRKKTKIYRKPWRVKKAKKFGIFEMPRATLGTSAKTMI